MSAKKPEAKKEEALLALGGDMRLAHQVLFKHRHTELTPAFHYEIIDLYHSDHPQCVTEAFRDGGKTTLAEEMFVTSASFRRYHNGIIVGASYDRAVERLASIKNEFENNEFILELFGDLKGKTWGENKIVLGNSICIQAFGAGQSLRGSKHLQWRPDFCLIDDLEDDDSVRTPEAREKMLRWLYRTLLPALGKNGKVRFIGNRLDQQAVIVKVASDPGWKSQRFPIMYRHEDGEWMDGLPDGQWKPTWPDKYPLPWIAKKRAEYERLGILGDFNCEYMCEADDPATKAFTSDLMRVEPTVRTWQAVYAMFDPARTVKSTSASTGVAIWSWLNNRLLVWDGYAGMWKPDEIISDMFKVDEQYRPVVLGVERDGLEEFILQPLRQEQMRRAYAIPIRPLKAPVGKLDFIRSLQPFFKAGEVIFAKELPQLREQLLGFPTGRIDIPNALAYALRLRPGAPIYDGFTVQHIAEALPIVARAPLYLAMNATPQVTTGALVQIVDGGLHVLRDWAREGDPGSNLDAIVREAGVEAQGKVRLFAGPAHFDQYDIVGLRAAARGIPVSVGRGGAELAGREEIRTLLGRMAKGQPAFRVSSEARWTLNALSGGYAKEVTRHGVLTDEAIPGPYRTLMEGIESVAALMKAVSLRDEEPVNYAFTADGRRYISSRAVA